MDPHSDDQALTARFNDREEALRWLHVTRDLARCPRCADMAVVVRAKDTRVGSRVTCRGCGFAREGHQLAPDAPAIGHVTGRCPACGRKLAFDREIRSGTTNVAVHCNGCGRSSRHPVRFERWTDRPSAPQFRGLDLWLQTECAGYTLWALEETHLDFLERYVAATIREQALGNSSLASRLPAWIKAARNRQTVLSGLVRLRAALPK